MHTSSTNLWTCVGQVVSDCSLCSDSRQGAAMVGYLVKCLPRSIADPWVCNDGDVLRCQRANSSFFPEQNFLASHRKKYHVEMLTVGIEGGIVPKQSVGSAFDAEPDLG